jgi:uncharacterized protein (DUF302 family)
MAGSGLRRELDSGYDEALARVVAALQSEGFGVMTEIDVRGALKRKLDVEFRPYRILGACNPSLAHRALEAGLDLGVFLPCNVVVYQADDGTSVVLAVDPVQTLAGPGRDDLRPLAEEVRGRLERVIARV